MKSTEIYKASSGEFHKAPSLPSKTTEHCFLKLNQTHFAIVGGKVNRVSFSTLGRNSKSLYTFDTNSQSWTQQPDMEIARSLAACAVLKTPRGLELVIAGGDGAVNGSTEILDVQTMIWRQGPKLPRPLRGPGFTVFGDSFVIVSGWSDVKSLVATYEILEYDVKVQAWNLRKEHISTSRHLASVIMVSNSTIPCFPTSHYFGEFYNISFFY